MLTTEVGEFIEGDGGCSADVIEILHCRAMWSENWVTVLRSAVADTSVEHVSVEKAKVVCCAEAKTKEVSLRLIMDHLKDLKYKGGPPRFTNAKGKMQVIDAKQLPWVRRVHADGYLATLLRNAKDGITENIPHNVGPEHEGALDRSRDREPRGGGSALSPKSAATNAMTSARRIELNTRVAENWIDLESMTGA